jgi:hypothetical protein
LSSAKSATSNVNVDEKDNYEAQKRARLNADDEEDSIDKMMIFL